MRAHPGHLAKREHGAGGAPVEAAPRADDVAEPREPALQRGDRRACALRVPTLRGMTSIVRLFAFSAPSASVASWRRAHDELAGAVGPVGQLEEAAAARDRAGSPSSWRATFLSPLKKRSVTFCPATNAPTLPRTRILSPTSDGRELAADALERERRASVVTGCGAGGDGGLLGDRGGRGQRQPGDGAEDDELAHRRDYAMRSGRRRAVASRAGRGDAQAAAAASGAAAAPASTVERAPEQRASVSDAIDARRPSPARISQPHSWSSPSANALLSACSAMHGYSEPVHWYSRHSPKPKAASGSA